MGISTTSVCAISRSPLSFPSRSEHLAANADLRRPPTPRLPWEGREREEGEREWIERPCVFLKAPKNALPVVDCIFFRSSAFCLVSAGEGEEWGEGRGLGTRKAGGWVECGQEKEFVWEKVGLSTCNNASAEPER